MVVVNCEACSLATPSGSDTGLSGLTFQRRPCSLAQFNEIVHEQINMLVEIYHSTKVS